MNITYITVSSSPVSFKSSMQNWRNNIFIKKLNARRLQLNYIISLFRILFYGCRHPAHLPSQRRASICWLQDTDCRCMSHNFCKGYSIRLSDVYYCLPWVEQNHGRLFMGFIGFFWSAKNSIFSLIFCNTSLVWKNVNVTENSR